MSKLHAEMRPWRAHLKDSRLISKGTILPRDIIELVYEYLSIDVDEVPLSEDERLDYLRFIYGNIQEKSSEWFDKRDLKPKQASELQKKLSKDKANLEGFGDE